MEKTGLLEDFTVVPKTGTMGGLVPVEKIIPDIVSYFGQIWSLRNGLDKYIFPIQSDWNQLGTYTLV
jgi:hypothetical protein